MYGKLRGGGQAQFLPGRCHPIGLFREVALRYGSPRPSLCHEAGGTARSLRGTSLAIPHENAAGFKGSVKRVMEGNLRIFLRQLASCEPGRIFVRHTLGS